MSIATLVAWMWMAAAQTHTQDCLWVHDGKAEHCEIGPIFVNPPKPAEHVIEIKTRRGPLDVKCFRRIKEVACGAFSGDCTPEAAEVIVNKCTEVTKTVYVDGQRWGILRESEGK